VFSPYSASVSFNWLRHKWLLSLSWCNNLWNFWTCG